MFSDEGVQMAFYFSFELIKEILQIVLNYVPHNNIICLPFYYVYILL